MEWVYKQHLVGEVLKMEQKVTKVHLSSGSAVLVEDRLAQRGCWAGSSYKTSAGNAVGSLIDSAAPSGMATRSR